MPNYKIESVIVIDESAPGVEQATIYEGGTAPHTEIAVALATATRRHPSWTAIHVHLSPKGVSNAN